MSLFPKPKRFIDLQSERDFVFKKKNSLQEVLEKNETRLAIRSELAKKHKEAKIRLQEQKKHKPRFVSAKKALGF